MAKGRVPKVYSLTVVGGSTYAANECDILSDTGKSAKFCQLSNFSATQDLNVKLNGKSDAVFVLEAGTAQVFNWGDLIISKVAFDNSASGAADVSAQVIVGY